MTLRQLKVPAAILAGVVWTLAFMVGMFTRDFVALGLTTPVVMLVAAAIFAVKNGNGGKNHEA